MGGLPEWSAAAVNSIGLHYRDLQEIEIYVEDKDAEALYIELLKRVIGDRVKIKKVICLNGRANVLAKCKSYEEEFPALFIIDGDLELLNGEREGAVERLFQHRLYCIENYLFCPQASIELLRESSGKLLAEEAIAALDWEEFIGSLLPPLLGLFKVYAVTWKLKPEESTVSRSYHEMCKRLTRKRGAVICEQKINETIEELKLKVIAESGEESFQQTYDNVTAAIERLSNPFYAISGKDYLLKALKDYLNFKGVKSLHPDESFKFRLARHCDPEPLNELGQAIFTTVNEGIYFQS